MTEDMVSFIVPVYNGEDTIKTAITSILSQSHQTIEVIIVDDGSTDDTERLVEEFNDNRIEYIKRPQNSGHSAASNIGIANAKGNYLALMDADIEISTNWCENLLDRMEALPDDVAVLQPKVVEDDEISKTEEGYTQVIQTCGVLAKSKAIDEINGYDEAYFAWVNDRELAARLINRGYRVYCEPSVEVRHKSPSWSGGQLSSLKTYHYMRNYLWHLWRHYDRISSIYHSALIIFYTVNRARTDGTLPSALKGIAASLRGFKKYYIDEHEPDINLEYSPDFR